MGRARRSRPDRLATKLRQIRAGLGLTQLQMLERLKNETGAPLRVSHISDFELNRRMPSLPLLLRYARMARVCLDVLADDTLELSAEKGISKHSEKHC